MQKQNINNLKVSKLCLGTHQFFDMNKNMNLREIKKIIFYAFDNGINFLDTADSYGNGKCEQLIGKIVSQNKLKIVVATKIGQKSNFKVSEIQKDIDNSLKRLNLDALDICYFHSGNNNQFDNLKYWEVISKNIKNGKIKNFGLSIKSSLIRQENFFQIKNMKENNINILNIIYNPLFDNAKKIFPYCSRNKIVLVSRVPFDKGRVFLKKNKKIVDKKLDEKNIKFKSTKDIIRWSIKDTPFKSVVFGVSSLSQLKSLL